jgi:hypothetical protein
MNQRLLSHLLIVALGAVIAAYLGRHYLGQPAGRSGTERAPLPAIAEPAVEAASSKQVLVKLRSTPVPEPVKDSAPATTGSSAASASGKDSLALLMLDALRARALQGEVDAMLELAKQLADSDPSNGGINESLHWLAQGTIMGSTDAAMLAGDLCLTRCYPADPDDPQDLNSWRHAAQYYLLAYLMGDERALKSLEAITPYGANVGDIYLALGVARMKLEEVTAARAQRGLGPLQMDLNATSPYLKPDPPTRGGRSEYLAPDPPPGG